MGNYQQVFIQKVYMYAYKYCSNFRLDMARAMLPVNPLEDKFLKKLTHNENQHSNDEFVCTRFCADQRTMM